MALSTCPRNEPRLVLTPPKQPMRQETRSNDTYDILHLDPVTLWLSSALITKLIFCNIEKWEDTVQKRNPDFTELTKANVKKRVSDWQQYICGPQTKRYLAKDHQLSRITDNVRGRFNSRQPLDNSRKDWDPFKFHILLLGSVSHALAECVKRGIGNKTFREVKKWFSLMKQLEKQNLITLASKQDRKWFIKQIDSNITGYSNRIDDNGNYSEYPFFDYIGTFINVAHINYSELNQPNYLGDHPDDKTETYSSVHFEKWEVATAYIFNEMFNIQGRGVPDKAKPAESGSAFDYLPFYDSYETVNNVTWKNADQNLTWEEREENTKKKIGNDPMIQKVHIEVLAKIDASLRDKFAQESIECKEEHSNLDKFEDICDTVECAMRNRQAKVGAREKVRKCYVKKTRRLGGEPYVPSPSVFERDIFLLGEMSYFHQVPIKEQARKRKRKHKDIVEIERDDIESDDL